MNQQTFLLSHLQRSVIKDIPELRFILLALQCLYAATGTENRCDGLTSNKSYGSEHTALSFWRGSIKYCSRKKLQNFPVRKWFFVPYMTIPAWVSLSKQLCFTSLFKTELSIRSGAMKMKINHSFQSCDTKHYVPPFSLSLKLMKKKFLTTGRTPTNKAATKMKPCQSSHILPREHFYSPGIYFLMARCRLLQPPQGTQES